MKVLFLQISDMHCKKNDGNLLHKIDQISPALTEIEPFDRIILIFSGDLADNTRACSH